VEEAPPAEGSLASHDTLERLGESARFAQLDDLDRDAIREFSSSPEPGEFNGEDAADGGEAPAEAPAPEDAPLELDIAGAVEGLVDEVATPVEETPVEAAPAEAAAVEEPPAEEAAPPPVEEEIATRELPPAEEVAPAEDAPPAEGSLASQDTLDRLGESARFAQLGDIDADAIKELSASPAPAEFSEEEEKGEAPVQALDFASPESAETPAEEVTAPPTEEEVPAATREIPAEPGPEPKPDAAPVEVAPVEVPPVETPAAEEVPPAEAEDPLSRPVVPPPGRSHRPYSIYEPGAGRELSPRRRRAAPSGPPSLASRFLAGRPVQCDDPEALAATVFELEDRLATSVEDARFSESVRTERAVETARAQLLESLKGPDRPSAKALTRAKDAQREFDKFSRQMALREQQLEGRLRTQVQQLRAKQQRELTDYDQQWFLEPRQRRYNRASQKIRVLRLQRQLLLTHRIDEPTSSERSEAQDYQTSRSLLEQRHADELDSLIQASDFRRSEFRYIKDTLAKRFSTRTGLPKPDEQPLADPDEFWAKAKRGEIEGLPAAPRRKVQVSKSPFGSDAPLSLPPLETDSSRKRKKVGP
jgi:hypothetical protein